MKHRLLSSGWLLAAGALPSVWAGAEAGAPVFTVVAKTEVKLADHTVTYVRVRPPVNLPTLPPPVAVAPPTPEQLADAERRESKVQERLNISAVVILSSPVLTELRLRVGEREFACYSNVDFRDLSQLVEFEGADTVYSWFPWVYEGGPGDGTVPAGLTLSLTESEYVVAATEADIAQHEAAFKGLDLIHAYYGLHKAELAGARETREAARLAQERELRAHPPQPADTTLYFWKKAAR